MEIDRSALMKDAWRIAKILDGFDGGNALYHLSDTLRTAWAIARREAAAAGDDVEMVQQQAQQQQANAGGETVDAIKGSIRTAAAAGQLDATAALFARLPGVERCRPDEFSDRLVIRARGTRCGGLDKAYSLPFLFEAFGIPALPKDDTHLDAAIERNHEKRRERAELLQRDGFDPAIDRTIVKGPFTAKLEPFGTDRMTRVTVHAALRNGTTRDLGTAIVSWAALRSQILEMALERLGYGHLGLDMDADDGSLIWTPARVALNRVLAKPGAS